MPHIAIINHSTVVSDQDGEAMTTALQKQVTKDFGPLWGCSADLLFVGNGHKAPKDAWWLAILDNSDQADALGYHDITPAGKPLGKAFAKSDIDNGYIVSVTVSHELLEMLADPEINLCAQVGPRLYAYEVCDPCEADEFGYKIDGVVVSDFVTPAWFAPPANHLKGPFDFNKLIEKPLTLLKGGYLQYLDLTGSAGWQQETAAKITARTRPRVGSRRERRRVGHSNWEVATANG